MACGSRCRYSGAVLRRSMVLSRGDPMIFVTRPLSLTLLMMAVAVVLLIALPQFRKTRETAFQE
jgi:putative tricarboxylic transport membrane protein